MAMQQKVYNPDAGENAAVGRLCFVLTASNQQCPGHLLNALSRRGFDVRFASTNADLFVKLTEQRPRAIVFIDPRQTSAGNQAAVAVKRYFPAVACWQYDSSGGKLSVIELNSQQKDNQPGKQSKVQMDNPADQTPSNDSNQDLIPENNNPSTNNATNLNHPTGQMRITQEELDMLLGPLPDPREDVEDGL